MSELDLNDLHNFTQDLSIFADNFEEQCRQDLMDKVRSKLVASRVNVYYKRLLAQNQACYSMKTRNKSNTLLLIRGDSA